MPQVSCLPVHLVASPQGPALGGAGESLQFLPDFRRLGRAQGQVR